MRNQSEWRWRWRVWLCVCIEPGWYCQASELIVAGMDTMVVYMAPYHCIALLALSLALQSCDYRG